MNKVWFAEILTETHKTSKGNFLCCHVCIFIHYEVLMQILFTFCFQFQILPDKVFPRFACQKGTFPPLSDYLTGTSDENCKGLYTIMTENNKMFLRCSSILSLHLVIIQIDLTQTYCCACFWPIFFNKGGTILYINSSKQHCMKIIFPNIFFHRIF